MTVPKASTKVKTRQSSDDNNDTDDNAPPPKRGLRNTLSLSVINSNNTNSNTTTTGGGGRNESKSRGTTRKSSKTSSISSNSNNNSSDDDDDMSKNTKEHSAASVMLAAKAAQKLKSRSSSSSSESKASSNRPPKPSSSSSSNTPTTNTNTPTNNASTGKRTGRPNRRLSATGGPSPDNSRSAPGRTTSATSSNSTGSQESNGLPSTKKRGVKFVNENSNEIFYIEHVSELSKRDKNKAWFTTNDFVDIERESQDLVYIIECGKTLKGDQTIRGLEKMLESGAIEYFSLRRDTVCSVLEGQEYYKSQNIDNSSSKGSNHGLSSSSSKKDPSVKIAQAYQQVSYLPNIRAKERALADYNEIKEYLFNDPACKPRAVRQAQIAEEQKLLKRKNMLSFTKSAYTSTPYIPNHNNNNTGENNTGVGSGTSSSSSKNKSSRNNIPVQSSRNIFSKSHTKENNNDHQIEEGGGEDDDDDDDNNAPEQKPARSMRMKRESSTTSFGGLSAAKSSNSIWNKLRFSNKGVKRNTPSRSTSTSTSTTSRSSLNDALFDTNNGDKDFGIPLASLGNFEEETKV